MLVVILLLALTYFLWRSTEVLLEAFAGVLFAVFLSSLAEALHKGTGLRYGWCLTVCGYRPCSLHAAFSDCTPCLTP